MARYNDRSVRNVSQCISPAQVAQVDVAIYSLSDKPVLALVSDNANKVAERRVAVKSVSGLLYTTVRRRRYGV